MFGSPVFVLGSALASLWAGLFQFLFGRRGQDIVLYWFISVVAFFAGQILASVLWAPFWMLGGIHIIDSSVACWLAMLVARWLKM
jgi:hypothetical protein